MRIGYIIFAILIFLAGGCTDDQIQNPEEHSDEVVTVLNIEPRRIRQGDEWLISFRVINQSPDTVTFRFPNRQQFGYALTLQGGETIYYPKYRSPATSQFTLLPGEERNFTRTFPSSIGRSNIYWPPGIEGVPLGVHTIKAGLMSHSDEYPWSKICVRVIQ